MMCDICADLMSNATPANTAFNTAEEEKGSQDNIANTVVIYGADLQYSSPTPTFRAFNTAGEH